MKIKSIKIMLAGILIVPVLALGIGLLTPASAQTCEGGFTIGNGAQCSQGSNTRGDLFGDGGIFTTIANVALFIIGAISVLMLIYGGIRYTISGGNEKNVTAAKNTILYAIVGIIVALLAYALVNFVITSMLAPSA